jgi:hypothetical protein
MSNTFYLYPILRNDASDPNNPDEYTSRDYPGCKFIIQSDLTSQLVDDQRQVNLTIEGALQQEILSGIITEKKAKCVLSILCENTFYSKDINLTLDPNGQFTTEVKIEGGDLHEELKIQAVIIACAKFPLTLAGGNTYDIESGQILAMSNELAFFLDPKVGRPVHEFFIVNAHNEQNKPWWVEFNGNDTENIHLYVSTEEKEILDKLAETQDPNTLAILHNAIMIPVLQNAIIQMQENDGVSKENLNYRSLEQSILEVDKNFFSTPDEEKVIKSFEIAQKIVAKFPNYKGCTPLLRMLKEIGGMGDLDG